MAAAASKAWIVAGSVGVIEALKDQGLARWNYALRSIHHHVKSNIPAVSLPQLLSSPLTVCTRTVDHPQAEESLRKVMFLSCWGPN